MADYIHAGCVAVFVCPERQFSDLPAPERQAIERHLHFAGDLRIDTGIICTEGHVRRRARGLCRTELGVSHREIFIGPTAAPPRRWLRGLDFRGAVPALLRRGGLSPNRGRETEAIPSRRSTLMVVIIYFQRVTDIIHTRGILL